MPRPRSSPRRVLIVYATDTSLQDLSEICAARTIVLLGRDGQEIERHALHFGPHVEDGSKN